MTKGCSRCKTWDSHSGEHYYYDYSVPHSVIHYPKHCQTAQWSTTEIDEEQTYDGKNNSLLRWDEPLGPSFDKDVTSLDPKICWDIFLPYVTVCGKQLISGSIAQCNKQNRTENKASFSTVCVRMRCNAHTRTICGLGKVSAVAPLIQVN